MDDFVKLSPTGQPASGAAYAWALDCAVGGSCLEFQQGDLLDNQRRYGGEIIPLYRDPPAPAVPDGYALVPLEPTPEMVAAAAFGGDVDLAIGHGAISEAVAQDYRNWLAAAPAARGWSDGSGPA